MPQLDSLLLNLCSNLLHTLIRRKVYTFMLEVDPMLVVKLSCRPSHRAKVLLLLLLSSYYFYYYYLDLLLILHSTPCKVPVERSARGSRVEQSPRRSYYWRPPRTPRTVVRRRWRKRRRRRRRRRRRKPPSVEPRLPRGPRRRR
jgi:hypothetical protein